MTLDQLPHNKSFLWNKDDEYPKKKVSIFIAAIGEVITSGYYYIREEGKIFCYGMDKNTDVLPI